MLLITIINKWLVPAVHGVFLLNIQVITTRGKTKQGGCHAAQYHYQIKYLFHFSYGFSHYKIYLMPKPYWV